MKKFIKKTVLAISLAIAIVAAVFGIRLIHGESLVRREYTLSDDIKVLCIGNSHTGCTWYESPEFKNRVLWQSASGLQNAYFRLKEVERLNDLGKVKVCIMDFDGHGLNYMTPAAIHSSFFLQFPISWRYADVLNINWLTLAAGIVCSTKWQFTDNVPEETAHWPARTKAEREYNISWQYGPYRPWNSELRDLAISMVRECKAICDEYGVRLIMFASPLAREAPDRCNPLWRDRVTEMIGKVKEMGVEFYDFRDNCDDSKFRDSHHLLKSASYEFTKAFFEEHIWEID